MQKLTVSAPGKIILHGEHSVVYGYKAIACALNLRCRVSLSDSSSEAIQITFEDLNHARVIVSKQNYDELRLLTHISTSSVTDSVKRINSYILEKELLGCPSSHTHALVNALTSLLLLLLNVLTAFSTVDINVCSEIPVGAGLGSSAAFSVALAGAFLVKEGCLSSNSDLWSVEDCGLISDLAFQSEIVMHGQPSGIDNTVSTRGGAVIFQKDGEIKPLIGFPQLRAILVNTRVPRMTKVIVKALRERYDVDPERHQQIFAQIEHIVEQAIKDCSDYSENRTILLEKFAVHIDRNQDLLTQLLVSHDAIDNICSLFKSLDVPGKLTGAGVGGCVFGLLSSIDSSSKESILRRDLEQQGFQVWFTGLGAQGVCLD